MKTRHTPGPWRCDGMKRFSDRTPDHFAVLGPNGIEAIADCFYGRTDNERAANARLISAAPRLLSALRGVLACHGPVSTVAESAKALREVEAAIAAATGEGV